MDINTRKQEVQWLLSSGNLEAGIKRAMDFIKDFGNTKQTVVSIVELSHQFNTQKGDKVLDETAKQTLTFSVFKLLDEAEQDFYKLQKQAIGNETALILRGIQKSFLSNRFQLSDINADFKLGEITGIVGPNANGKSTLMRIAVGELSADKGALTFPYFEKVNPRLTWDTLKHLIAYVPQELPRWQGELKDNLRYEAALHGIYGAENALEVDYIIERLGLTRYKNARWEQLSGGYKLRFALAKALIWKPIVLVLDEPLANLDVNAQTLVLNDLKDLAHSFLNPISVLISSQHIHEIEHVADNIIVLEEGEIKYNGKRSEYGLTNNYHVFEFSCTTAPKDLEHIFTQIPSAKMRSHGYYYSLKTDKTVSPQTVLTTFQTHNIEVDYFRDISRSVKQMFLS
jgi:ABC-type multidrug transport system ATPase subunit